MPLADYPRMMYHRTLDPVIVNSKEEESALGREWRRTVWTADDVSNAVPPPPVETPAPKPEAAREAPAPEPSPRPEPAREQPKVPQRKTVVTPPARRKTHG